MQTIHKHPQSSINRDSYDNLMVAIEAGQGDLNLLLAVCDDPDFAESVINAYEAELKTMAIQAFRSVVDFDDPSLYTALSRLYHSEHYLQNQKRAVITITGITKLLNLKLGEKRSKVEIFSDYLQYTREGLRKFPYPIVLWLTEEIHDHIALNAIDFYSWRSGVFFFDTKNFFELSGKSITALNVIDDSNEKRIQSPKTFSQLEDQGVGMLKIDDLEALIRQNNNESDFGLINLYSSLGSAYKHRLEIGQSTNYQADLQAAINAYEKAIELQAAVGETLDLAIICNNLASLYNCQGSHINLSKAEDLLKKSLRITERIVGENHQLSVINYNNLAISYFANRKVAEAERILKKCCQVQEKSLENNPILVLPTLINLANVYQFQGRYKESEKLLLQALKIQQDKQEQNIPDIATTIDLLAQLNDFKGQLYSANQLSLYALKIRENKLGYNHPDVANTLNNIAVRYEYRGDYQKANYFYQKALEVFDKTLGVGHPNTIKVRANYANCLKLITHQKETILNGGHSFSSSG